MTSITVDFLEMSFIGYVCPIDFKFILAIASCIMDGGGGVEEPWDRVDECNFTDSCRASYNAKINGWCQKELYIGVFKINPTLIYITGADRSKSSKFNEFMYITDIINPEMFTDYKYLIHSVLTNLIKLIEKDFNKLSQLAQSAIKEKLKKDGCNQTLATGYNIADCLTKKYLNRSVSVDAETDSVLYNFRSESPPTEAAAPTPSTAVRPASPLPPGDAKEEDDLSNALAASMAASSSPSPSPPPSTTPPPSMPLTQEELEAIQDEFLAHDIPLEAEMLLWTAEQVRAYFDSGGKVKPLPPPTPAPEASAAASPPREEPAPPALPAEDPEAPPAPPAEDPEASAAASPLREEPAPPASSASLAPTPPAPPASSASSAPTPPAPPASSASSAPTPPPSTEDPEASAAASPPREEPAPPASSASSAPTPPSAEDPEAPASWKGPLRPNVLSDELDEATKIWGNSLLSKSTPGADTDTPALAAGPDAALPKVRGRRRGGGHHPDRQWRGGPRSHKARLMILIRERGQIS